MRRILLVAATLLVPASVAAFDVPILVDQPLPHGVPAYPTWTGEPVSAGIPFAPEAGLTDVRALGMRGTPAAQFRVLQRDPRSGAITWVLATFLAGDAPVAVVAGCGAFGGVDLARERASDILVSTGAAQFEIRKQGFNGFARVVLAGGRQLVPPRDTGGVVVEAGGRRYTSASDAGSEVVIEENGPVAATIRARGVVRDPAGAGLLQYTARLHFYRGQSFCRLFVTLRNADLASLSAKRFDAAWFEVPLALAAPRQVRFGFPGDGFAATLPAGGAAHLFQGDNTLLRASRTTNLLPELTPAVGLEVVLGGEVHNRLGDAGDIAQGWMRIADAGHAVVVGMRDFAPSFPSGFDLAGERLAIEMFSRRNPKRDLVFSWGAHETREIHLAFGGPDVDVERFRARLQAPPIGRCAYARYRDTGAIRGERRLVTVEEETEFFAVQGRRWQPLRLAMSDLRFDRSYSFGRTGGGNQFDQDEVHLIDWLRTGGGGRFQQGRMGTVWKADQAVLHSDDFDYGLRQNGISDVRVDQPVGFHGKGAGNGFDDEHPHWTCMPLYYHLTGDERIREAIADYGEWRLYRAGHPFFGAAHGGAIKHFRLWSRCFRDVAMLYELTGEARYLDAVRVMSRTLTGTLETGTSRGRSLERGYFYFGDEANVERRIHLFFLTEMNPQGVLEAMRVLPPNDPLVEELRDYLYGLAWFTLQEAQILADAPGYPYGYFTAAPNPAPGDRGDQTGILLAHGYEMTGHSEFIRRAAPLAWRVQEDSHPLRAGELPQQARIYRCLHREDVGAALLTPRTERNADGSWTLRWTAPPRASRFIVKYGPRRLVETLGFDPVHRTFTIDPEAAMNFWAATNLAGEPVPNVAGGIVTWRTPILPAGEWHFAIKVLADRPLEERLRIGSVRLPDTPPVAVPAPNTGTPGSAPSLPQRSAAELPEPARMAQLAERSAARPAFRAQARADGIAFEGLPAGAEVRLYDVAGRLLHALRSEASGRAVWDGHTQDGRRVARGVLLFRVEVQGETVRRDRIVWTRAAVR